MLIRLLRIMQIILILAISLIATQFSRGDELVIEIDNPKFSEKGLNDKVYEIKAKKGLKTDNELKLFIVEGKFKTVENGKWIYLEAEKGNFSQTNNLIELESNIIFYTDDGEKIQSNYATFDMNENIIKLKENVSHESIEGLILSNSSLILNNFNKIIYTGNVETTIKN